jgi:8-oxoguanine deaminase
MFDVRGLGFAGGAVHDPIASLALCAGAPAAYTIVNGRVVVREGQLTTLDLGPLIDQHNRMAMQLVVSA